MLLGLRTIIYPAPRLEPTKAWFTETLGVEPYFDEPFYVGYNIGGYELGLDPNADVAQGPVTYWGVAKVEDAVAHFVSRGATVKEEAHEVGDGIRVATVILPQSTIAFGLIENPHFELHPEPTDGPGV
jgi:hypothetical protein